MDDSHSPGAKELDALEVVAAAGRVIKRNWAFLLSCSLGSAVLAILFSFLTKPSFTAVSSFIPPSGSSSSGAAAALMSQLSAASGASSLLGAGKTSGDLYVGILKSQTISHLLVKQFHLLDVYKVKKESQAEKQLANHSVFAIGTKDTIVSVSVTDANPARARDMANAYLDALRSTTGGLALTESSQRRQFFEQRLAIEKDELAKAEVALKRAQEQSGLIAPAGQTALEIGAVGQLRAQMAAAEVRLATLRTGESDENPDILRVQQELSSLRTQINQMERGKGSSTGGLSAAQVPGLALEYVRLARDVKYHETIFDILAKQYENARLDEAHDATLQVLDRANIPDTKSGPNRLIYMVVGLIAGPLLGLAWKLYRSPAGGSSA